jgi:uncharacterized protein (TIGR02265 family)
LVSRFVSARPPEEELLAGDFSRFAAQVASDSREQAIISHNLTTFPAAVRSRGVFFEGLVRALSETVGTNEAVKLMDEAGVIPRTVPFRFYPHREFYRLYYLAASVLEPGRPMPTRLRRLARTFFPIFRNSLLGKTMSAFMGDHPATILPLLAQAYNLSVESNRHEVVAIRANELVWSAAAEAVEWYPETMMGIIEGAMPVECTPQVALEKSAAFGVLRKYEFRIR